jgi:hypothetical protein
MTTVELARWQFAFTSINHFHLVPITIGLAFLTALLQTVVSQQARRVSAADQVLRHLLVINGSCSNARNTTRSRGHGGSLHPVTQAGRTADIPRQQPQDTRTGSAHNAGVTGSVAGRA